MPTAADLWKPGQLDDGTQLEAPITIALASASGRRLVPQLQVSRALLPDGTRGIHAALFNFAADQWVSALATPDEALKVAAAFMSQAAAAEWPHR